jgi:hypothetical protein
MNPHADMDSVSADSPILRSDEISMTKNTDGLIREIIQVLERCSKQETTFSHEERADNEYLINRVLRFYLAIEADKEEGQKALLFLLHKRLATPDNLAMLLRTVDTDVQTGKIRCIAFKLLGRLVSLDAAVWSLKMKDGSYLTTSFIVASSKALENETNEDCNNHHTERSCSCALYATMFLNSAMDIERVRSKVILDRRLTLVFSFSILTVLMSILYCHL